MQGAKIGVQSSSAHLEGNQVHFSSFEVVQSGACYIGTPACSVLLPPSNMQVLFRVHRWIGDR